MKKLANRLFRSRIAGWVLNLPPIAWLIRTFTAGLFARLLTPASDSALVTETIEKSAVADLDATLERIVQDMVNAFGYVGAMIALYEHGDLLPVRALYVDPRIATRVQIQSWEVEMSKIAGEPVSITDPEIARVFVYQDKYKDNLSVRAIKAGRPVISDELYALFTPIAPAASKAFVQVIQDTLSIRQVVAVPFFLETATNGQPAREVVGNLFAISRDNILEKDILMLSAFGRQVAAVIASERSRLQIQVAQKLTLMMQSNLQDEQEILRRLVRELVTDFGYVGAVVATYEQDKSLPARALYVDPAIATEAQIHEWEAKISALAGKPLSITDPDTAKVFIHQDMYKDNISVQSYMAGEPVTSDDLYTLFTPIVPPTARPLVKAIQTALGIERLISVPFFFQKTPQNSQPTHEIVGNLIIVTKSRRFSHGEIEAFKVFGQQVAAGIRNARLYRKAEERRQIAQQFGTMAFTATAYIHELRNLMASIKLYLDVVVNPSDVQEQQTLEIMRSKTTGIISILDNLHEPWKKVSGQLPVDVNHCLKFAIRKLVGRDDFSSDTIMIVAGGEQKNDPGRQDAGSAERTIVIKHSFATELPKIFVAEEMLIETFRILIKNALEATMEKENGCQIIVESRLIDDTAIEVLISDDGVGIKPKHLTRIFDLGWSTKEEGMGFGLFWTKDYIEGLGGELYTESTWQTGTTFYVRLPLLIEQPAGHD